MGATGTRSENAAERIDRGLTRAILRGEHAPGTNLPTVRDLAATHDVNPATVQRALARLESRGLVTARQGSGLRVNDPAEVGDLSLVPDWLAATDDDPDRAAAILAELLEVRRVMAVRLIARHRLEVLDAIADLKADAGNLLAVPASEVWHADIEFARTMIRATGNTVAAAVLNSLARSLAELPVLVEAMYSRPERNVAAMLEVLRAVRDGGDDLAERIDAAMVIADEETVSAFRRLLLEAGGR